MSGRAAGRANHDEIARFDQAAAGRVQTMSWPAWLYRLVPYLGRRAAERDLQEELRLHLKLERERQRDAGVPEAEAALAARRTLGNGTLIRERTRDVWGWRWLDDLGRDVRHALRGLRRGPGFTGTVVLVLALGIGANTALFSVVYGLLLRPLPYPYPEAIVLVGKVWPDRTGPPTLTNPELRALWADAGSFEQLAASSRVAVPWTRPDGNLSGQAVTPSYFSLLGATPHLGRLFTAADAEEGAPPVVLLSHGAWTNRLGSDPDVVGATAALDNGPYTVVGVLPEDFEPPGSSPRFWTPLAVAPYEPSPDGALQKPGFMLGIGRLRPGVSPDEAQAEVQTMLDRQEAQRAWPELGPAPEGRVVRLREELGRPFRPALAMLAAATGLVLLMACANVAGLLLARGIARRRELAIRGALGAGRGRVVRQLLAESVLLSVAGGVVGCAVAAAIVRAAPALIPRSVPGLADVALDGVALAFTAGLAVAAGLVFGTAPALAWSRVDPTRAIHAGHGAAGGDLGRLRANRGQAGLAVAQVALAVVLLTGAGLLLRSFVAFATLDRGFDPTNVVRVRVSTGAPGAYARLGGGRLDPDEVDASNAVVLQVTEALRGQMARLKDLPGVAAAARSSGLPLNSADSMQPFEVAGRPRPSDPGEQSWAGVRTVDPGYAEVMRLRLRDGRFLAESDGPGGPRAAVVSESFARAAFGGEPAVGQRLRLGYGREWEVVGVVANVTPLYDLSRLPGVGDVYLPMHQSERNPPPYSSPPNVMVRAEDDPDAVIPFVQAVLARVHPEAQVYATPLDTMLSREAAQPRFYAACAGIFAGVALLLAAFGLYSILSYAVSRRRRELGVRMALGAGRADVVRLVVRQGGTLVAAGSVLGLLAAAATTRVVESVLFGVTATDGLTFAGVTAVVLAAGLLACWLPARRATRIDPMEVLRFE